MVRKIFFTVLTLVIFSPAAARAQGGGAPDVDTHGAEVGVIGSPAVTSDITHNFQFSVGFGYRF